MTMMAKQRATKADLIMLEAIFLVYQQKKRVYCCVGNPLWKSIS